MSHRFGTKIANQTPRIYQRQAGLGWYHCFCKLFCAGKDSVCEPVPEYDFQKMQILQNFRSIRHRHSNIKSNTMNQYQILEKVVAGGFRWMNQRIFSYVLAEFLKRELLATVGTLKKRIECDQCYFLGTLRRRKLSTLAKYRGLSAMMEQYK